jgi:hypothetical protein
MLLAPVMAALADRRSPTELLVGGYIVQALGMVGVAISLWASASPYAAYGLAVLASTAMTTTRPAQFTLLPALARDAQQLTAANVVAGWAENAGMLLAALVAALFLGTGQIGALFAVCAGLVAGAAVLAAPVRVAGIALAGDGDGGEPGGLRTVLEGPRRWPASAGRGCWSACSPRSSSWSARSTCCSWCWPSRSSAGARYGSAT